MNPSLEKRCVNDGLAEDMGPSPLRFKNQLWLLLWLVIWWLVTGLLYLHTYFSN